MGMGSKLCWFVIKTIWTNVDNFRWMKQQIFKLHILLKVVRTAIFRIGFQFIRDQIPNLLNQRFVEPLHRSKWPWGIHNNNSKGDSKKRQIRRRNHVLRNTCRDMIVLFECLNQQFGIHLLIAWQRKCGIFMNQPILMKSMNVPQELSCDMRFLFSSPTFNSFQNNVWVRLQIYCKKLRGWVSCLKWLRRNLD